MKLARYEQGGEARIGVVAGDRIVDAGAGSMIDLIADLALGVVKQGDAGGLVALPLFESRRLLLTLS